MSRLDLIPCRRMRQVSSTFALIVSPVNDGPVIGATYETSMCLFEGCDLVITINDIDASDAYCPMAHGNYFLVTLSFNASVAGAVSLPRSMGLSSLTFTENSSTTMTFHASVSHFNGVPLSVTLNLNDSDSFYSGSERTYIEAKITVSDEGRCGGEVLEVKMDNASVVLNISPKMNEPAASSVESPSTAGDTAGTGAVLSASSLIDDTQIDVDLLETWQRSSRKILHGLQFFNFLELDPKSAVGMRITCIDQNSCGDGEFILPFPSCVEIGVAFYADNFNTSSAAHGGGIKLSGTAIRVQRAVEEITFDGYMRNNSILLVELFADASFSTVVDNTTIALVFSSDVGERSWKITNKLTIPLLWMVAWTSLHSLS